MADQSKERKRAWCFTLNNYTLDQYNHICSVDCAYLVCGKETGESGTPHLQGFIYFATLKSFKQIKKILGDTCHVESLYSTPQQASDYCKKQNDFFEKGNLPMQGKRTDLEVVCTKVLGGASVSDVAKEHPTTFVRYSRGIRELVLAVAEPYSRVGVCGVWCVGPPGCGKSHYAQMNYTNKYNKAQNKWFDGYTGEKVIILEDLDCGALCHMLKIWSDKWDCTGETKGGTVRLCHDTFVVTSNYTIEEIVPKVSRDGIMVEDQPMVEALKRRFKVRVFSRVFDPPIGDVGTGRWLSVMVDENGIEHVLGELPS